MTKFSAWAHAHKMHAAAATCTVLIAATVTGCGNANSAAKTASTSAASAAASTAATEAAQDVQVSLTATADTAWDSNSTALIVRISGGDVDVYHALSADKPTDTLTLPEGSYTVSYVTPINADGSVFQAGGTQAITVTAGDTEANQVSCKLKHISADKTSDEKLGFTVTKLGKALAAGDDSLKGEAATALVETFKKNIAANPNVSDATKAAADKISA